MIFPINNIINNITQIEFDPQKVQTPTAVEIEAMTLHTIYEGAAWKPSTKGHWICICSPSQGSPSVQIFSIHRTFSLFMYYGKKVIGFLKFSSPGGAGRVYKLQFFTQFRATLQATAGRSDLTVGQGLIKKLPRLCHPSSAPESPCRPHEPYQESSNDHITMSNHHIVYKTITKSVSK